MNQCIEMKKMYCFWQNPMKRKRKRKRDDVKGHQRVSVMVFIGSAWRTTTFDILLEGWHLRWKSLEIFQEKHEIQTLNMTVCRENVRCQHTNNSKFSEFQEMGEEREQMKRKRSECYVVRKLQHRREFLLRQQIREPLQEVMVSEDHDSQTHWRGPHKPKTLIPQTMK
jgi:hypothetical protein